MNIKDYLHLYLGCECMVIGIKHILSGIYPPDACFVNTLSGLTLNPIDITSVKPILRPLSDMTEEEKTWFVNEANDLSVDFVLNEMHFEIKHDTMKKYYYDALTLADNDDQYRLGPGWYFMATQYLLKQGFDLFGLIDAGLAIDKTTLK